MAELLLSAALPILIEKATDLVIGEFHAAQDVEKDCQKLCRILPAVLAVVDDAEKRSGAEPAVREWVRSLKAVAYEAEDVLDEMKYDAIAEAVETDIQLEERKAPHCFPRCSLFKNNIFKSYSNDKRLKGILENIETIIAEMDHFGFLKNQQPVTTIVNRPRSDSSVVQSTVFGRNDDLEKIVVIVKSHADSERITVIPIVRMGGLGKTTLTKLVYNSERIKENFDLKLWVCVSDEFCVNNLAKSIIDLAIKKDSKVPLDNNELISHKLRENLGGKRYLLDLDDVWNENKAMWEQLKRLLDCGNPKSVVIVTTRSKRVASIVGNMEAYELQELNEDDLWGIFRQKALQIGVDERPELIEIGKQMIKKCCGSTLVATTLGGLMSYKKEESEWLDVLENDNLVVEDEILPVLKLSYENLPSHMKWCFAFCAVYPKDFNIERDILIQLWIANSYIPLEGSMEMEAKGMEISNELVWRGFFQDIKENYRGVVECKMHDLIHDLAQSLMGTTCVSLPSSVQQSDNLCKETFHVSSSSREAMCSFFKECSTLHTILSLSNKNIHDKSSRVAIDLFKAKLCRALSFRKIPVELHIEHKKLKHLRYLDLFNCNIEVLPEALCTAYNLQTLMLSWCQNLVCLPKGMRHMRSLRHVYLDECNSLERMPAGMGKLSCLQTLTRYIVDPSIGCGIEQLKDLINLGGRLSLRGLQEVGNQQEAKLANLISKKRLSHLELYWGSLVDPDSARDVLEGLEPCRTLQSFKIRYYNGVEFAAWMHNPTKLRNLTKLALFNCLQSRVLGPICQLPLLKELELQELKSLKHICSGSTMLAQRQGDGDNQELHMFPKLQKLKLWGLESLENWQETDPAEQTSRALPQLRHLRIEYCPKLVVLPSCPLLEYLTLLKLDSLTHICCSGSALLDGDGRALPMFPRLENLFLENMWNLERWVETDAAESTSLALPRLHGLSIVTCPKLDALPSRPSLSYLVLSQVGLKHICSTRSALLEPIFPTLQGLGLNEMLALEKWQENDPREETSLALPQLRNLEIGECPKLDALPSCPFLTELEITGSTTKIPYSGVEYFINSGVLKS